MMMGLGYSCDHPDCRAVFVPPAKGDATDQAFAAGWRFYRKNRTSGEKGRGPWAHFCPAHADEHRPIVEST
jgi:hypothetical protein